MTRSPNKKSIRDAGVAIKVTDFIEYKDYLEAVYQHVKAALPSYSYIKFAEDLGIGTTNMMRLVVIGDRKLTAKAAMKVLAILELHGDERRYFKTMVDYVNARKPEERDRLFGDLMAYKSRVTPKELSASQNDYFQEWFNPVIREMTMLEGFQGNPEWIRSHLNFPLHMAEIKKALDVLVQLKYVTYKEKSGEYRRTSDKVHTPFEVDSIAMVRYHQKMIEIARESITRLDEHHREVSAQTVAIPASAVPELKAKIQKLMDEMEALESGDPGAQVFQLNVQLFPFTKV